MVYTKPMQYKTKKSLYYAGFYALRTFNDVEGSSPAIEKAKEKALLYAQYESPILLIGETGTGKDVFAQSIHLASLRRSGPFVPVNCAAFPENLIESELFGYEKGAFTGASEKGKIGFFELADHGTIFLDEISELPIAIQSKLLRVIEEREFIRVGGNSITPVDIRIICSSNKDILRLIEEKKFKEDLYYRLNVLEVKLPPLRERLGDIQLLAKLFLKEFNKIYHKNIKDFTPETMAIMVSLSYPGNVRELSNMVERMVILAKGDTISKDILGETIDLKTLDSKSSKDRDSIHTSDYADDLNLKRLQQRTIIAALEKNNGNKSAAARDLGISPATLWRKIREYDL